MSCNVIERDGAALIGKWSTYLNRDGGGRVALIRIGALINKNTFQGRGRLLEGGR